ncbi:MAG: PKD domain-containing protein [Candidatus Poseidoniales archaeon]
MTQKLRLIAALIFLSLFCVMNTEAAPSTGTIQVVFIMAEFEDQDFDDERDQDYFEDLAFGSSDSMWHYYDEVSGGQLTIEGDVFGPYTLDGDAADYSSGTSFVRDSVEIADDDIDFRNYDAVMAIHSGPGGESTGDNDDIWSAHWPSITIDTNDGDYQIKKITQIPEYEQSSGEREPLGVWCHEFGHELGLPDFYDTDGSSEGSGNWAVMAAGSWGNNGETPVYFSAYSRYWLGWEEPILIEDDINNLVLEPISEGGEVYKLPIPGNWSNSKQYFLIENRQQTNYDSYLPGEGLLIWHIDEEVLNSKWNSNTVNNDEEHKGMDLEEADGNDDLDSGANRGDAGDPYNSGTFSKDSYPNSLAYNGTESGWKIENIETSGDNIILDISFLSKPHAVADADEAVITEGLELQFYGNESWDEDGNIVNYTWDFGDGEFAYTDNPSHIFIENGSYDVVLTVRDNNGLEDSFILNIFVNKRPIPVVQISKLIIMLGEEITFDASDSYDVDGEVEFYQWNFDDGYTSNMATIDHEYKNSGIYNVSLKLIDDLSDITTVYYIIEVINKLPIVDFEINPDSGNTLVTFQFVDLSYDDDGEIEQWFWDFGDGETSTGQIAEHQFGLPGTYYVTLSVTDDQDGTNSTIISFEVENAPPTSQIRIPDGINLGNNNWKIPANRNIMIDGSASFDNEGDELEFLWTLNGQELSTETIDLNLAEETALELKVIDSRGGEDTETFTIIPQIVPSLTIVNWEDSTQVIKNEIGNLQTYSENGEFNLYMWKVERLGMEINENILIDTANYDSLKPEWEEGEYLLKVSAKDIETNLWTENFSMTIFVYNNPYATFEFNNTINEGQWITFDSTESGGFWNGSNSLDPNELELSHKWTLDGEELAGTNELITTLIESGGTHTINLTVFQNPIGKSYYEVEFYADYMPWGIMNTFPQNPRYGEDFEIYLNAYDEEDEAYINFLKISVYDYEGTQRAELLYEDQGSNFNLIVEIEYTGTIILEYELMDEKGNFRTNISTIEVLGWPDIYIESLEIEGTKEKGKTQNIEFILKNYNKTYESVLYNGAVAIGTVDLLINDEIVKSWNYNIEGEESQVFNFEWIAPAGYYEFEVIASVSNGETILENNNMTKSATFKADVKSSILPYPNFVTASVLLIGISVLKHRKPN